MTTITLTGIRTSRKFDIIAVSTGLIGLVAAVSLTWQAAKPSIETRLRISEEAHLNAVSKDVEQTRHLIQNLTNALNKYSTGTVPMAAFAQVRAEIDELRKRLESYEIALGDDPAKKLAVPLLRKDIDILRDEHKADLVALHDEISRMFDLMKWLLGLVGLGSLLGGVSGFFKRGLPDKAAEVK